MPRPDPASRNSHRMTFGGRVLVCVISEAANRILIQFLLGHVSIQTTERYLGCKHVAPGVLPLLKFSVKSPITAKGGFKIEGSWTPFDRAAWAMAHMPRESFDLIRSALARANEGRSTSGDAHIERARILHYVGFHADELVNHIRTEVTRASHNVRESRQDPFDAHKYSGDATGPEIHVLIGSDHYPKQINNAVIASEAVYAD
jgi:hypothetical protein